MLTEHLRWMYRAWFYRLRVEREEIAFLLKHLAPGQTAIDVGAHKGAFTYWMAKRVGPTGKVVAFEPQRVLAERLQKLVRSAGMTQVTVENKGVSSREGTAILSVPGGRPSPGATLESPTNSECEQSPVGIVTLDHYFSKLNVPPVRLIKIDVEGHELDVFRGASNILREYKPIILFECETRHHKNRSLDDVFQHLTSLGYVGYFFLRGRISKLEEFDAAIHQSDPQHRFYANNFIFAQSALSF